MSVFSLDWFRSEKKKEMNNLLIEEQRLWNEKLRREVKPIETNDITSERPFKSLKLVNTILTVTLNDGSIISKTDATPDMFKNVRNSKTEREILILMGSREGMEEKEQQKKETEKVITIINGMKKLYKLKDFEVKDNVVYLKGISRSVPALLIKEFAKIADRIPSYADINKDEEYLSLKRFFMWCCLNPRAEVADKLYDFLQKNGMRITRQGFFVALRNVVEVKGNGDTEIVKFISNAYNKVKAVWKKKPEDFRIVDVGNEYKLEKVSNINPEGPIVGNLDTLYVYLPNMRENRFTDSWTHTFDIRIGKVVTMPMDKCNWSTQDCAAAGLHFSGHTAPYVLCGDTSIFMLINPMKVVGIGEEKGRCYEYLPFMTTNVEEASEIMRSEDYDFLQMDEDYTIHELEGLEKKVKAGFTSETKKHQFNLPNLSSLEMSNIITSLDEMKKEISKRVTSIS